MLDTTETTATAEAQRIAAAIDTLRKDGTHSDSGSRAAMRLLAQLRLADCLAAVETLRDAGLDWLPVDRDIAAAYTLAHFEAYSRPIVAGQINGVQDRILRVDLRSRS